MADTIIGTYKTTKTAGMKTRPYHYTNNTSNGAVPYDVVQQVLEFWKAPADEWAIVNNVNTKITMKDDEWVRIQDPQNDPEQEWVAVKHLGVIYGVYTPTTVTPPDPTDPIPPAFPESFVLTDPSGAKAEYVFVRIIEA